MKMCELNKNTSENISSQALQSSNYRAKFSCFNETMTTCLYKQEQEITQLTETNYVLVKRIEQLENNLDEACKLIQ